MNRETLFRGKRIDNGEWIEGFYMPRPNSPNKPRDYIVTIGTAKWYEVDPETVCPYTGLTDKNDSGNIFDNPEPCEAQDTSTMQPASNEYCPRI